MSYIDFYEIPGNCPLENELRMNVSLKKKCVAVLKSHMRLRNE